MLRGSLLAAALFTLLGLGSGTGHVRDGRIAYEHVGNGKRFQIYTVTATGAHRQPLTTSRRYSSYDPASAPRGERIVFPDMIQLDLWVMNPDGSDVRRVTNTPNRDESDPAWSPDGRRIVFSAHGAFHGASSLQLYVADANGTQSQILTHACGECAWVNADPSWQPLP